jgi:hypothetical protein
MLSSLLAPLVCAALPAIDPLDFQVAAALGRAPIVAGIHVTATQFRARNFSSVPQLYVFKETSGGEIAVRPLLAGGEMAFSFPADALADFEVEVASKDRGVWSNTGLLKLQGLNSHEGSLVWIEVSSGRASAWLETGGGSLPLESGASELPGRVVETIRESDFPTHVPVITPSDHPSGDLPPKLEDKPLPPV